MGASDHLWVYQNRILNNSGWAMYRNSSNILTNCEVNANNIWYNKDGNWMDSTACWMHDNYFQ